MTPRRRSPSGRRRDHAIDFPKAPAGPAAVDAGGFRRGAALAGRPTPPERLEAARQVPPAPSHAPRAPPQGHRLAATAPAGHSGPIPQNQLAYQYLQDLQEEFADSGVLILAMSCWERGDPTNHMKRFGHTYGVMSHATELARRYRVDHLPTFYVIGVNGQVIYRKEGFKESTAKQMAGVIDRHLKVHGRRKDKVQTTALTP